MKWNALVITLSLSLGSTITNGQSIISIKEIDQNNKTYTDVSNIDINSKVVIKFDRSGFIRKINKIGAGNKLPQDAASLLDFLYESNLKVDSWALDMESAIKDYLASDRTNKLAVINKTAAVSMDVYNLLDRDPKTKEYFESAAGFGPLDFWGPLIYALNKRINDLESELASSSSYNDLQIQIGGWLMHNNQSSPLHFNGLDSNPAGEYYEVERWKFTLTEEQLKQLEALHQSTKNSEQREFNINELFRSDYIKQFTKAISKTLQTDFDDFKKEAQKVLVKTIDADVKTDITTILSKTTELKKVLTEKVSYYESISSSTSFSLPELIAKIQTDVTFVNSEFNSIKVLLTTFQSDLTSASAGTKADCANLLVIATSKASMLANDIISSDILIWKPEGTKLTDISLKFTDKIYALSLGNIPEEALTDLLFSGFREVGDRVVVKILIKNVSAEKDIFEESQSVTLYRILPHLEGTVGVIFAHPLSTTKITKDVQMAPYYNLLFKGILGMSQKWKRKSALPNTMLDTSFGLHMSSPDFDKDDVPELGVGVVASTLKDYLQAGWAYNLFHGTGYVFFGIRLPVPSMNFGGNGGTSGSIK
jgi:hypothetical protein